MADQSSTSPVWDFFTNPAVTGVIGTVVGTIGALFTNLVNRGPALQMQINEAFSHLIEGYEKRISDLENHIEELKDHVIDLKTVIDQHGLKVPDARINPHRKM